MILRKGKSGIFPFLLPLQLDDSVYEYYTAVHTIMKRTVFLSEFRYGARLVRFMRLQMVWKRHFFSTQTRGETSMQTDAVSQLVSHTLTVSLPSPWSDTETPAKSKVFSTSYRYCTVCSTGHCIRQSLAVGGEIHSQFTSKRQFSSHPF